MEEDISPKEKSPWMARKYDPGEDGAREFEEQEANGSNGDGSDDQDEKESNLMSVSNRDTVADLESTSEKQAKESMKVEVIDVKEEGPVAEVDPFPLKNHSPDVVMPECYEGSGETKDPKCNVGSSLLPLHYRQADVKDKKLKEEAMFSDPENECSSDRIIVTKTEDDSVPDDVMSVESEHIKLEEEYIDSDECNQNLSPNEMKPVLVGPADCVAVVNEDSSIALQEQFVDPVNCSYEEEHSEISNTIIEVDPLYCSDEDPLLSTEAECFSKAHLRKETRTLPKDRPYKCNQCSKTFSMLRGLSQHLRIHGKGTPLTCEHCGKAFSLLSRLVKHLQTHVGTKCKDCGLAVGDKSGVTSQRCLCHSEETYDCKECDEKFNNAEDLENHLEMHASPQNEHRCKVCGRMFGNRGALVQHFKSHGILKCYECGKNFSSHESLMKHSKMHRVGHKCHLCGKTFPERYRLNRHVKVHGAITHVDAKAAPAARKKSFPRVKPIWIKFPEVKHKCDVCGSSFSNLKNLEKHSKTHKTPYKCDQCNKSFSKETFLRKHYHSVHLSAQIFKCTECELSFISDDELQGHLQTHDKHHQPHKCNTCGDSFDEYNKLISHLVTHNNEIKFGTNSSQLLSHPSGISGLSTPMVMIPCLLNNQRSNDVLGQKMHNCGECGKIFNKKELLMKHMQTHKCKQFVCKACSTNFFELDQLVLHLISQCNDAPYICQVCMKDFRERYRLIRHLKSHLGTREYKCTHCDKSFIDQYYRDIHARTHSGERPYQCPDCDRNYTMRASLTSHMKRHHGRKMFTCQFCGLCYTEESELTKHVKKHNVKKTKCFPPNNNPQKQYKCHICPKGFNRTSNLSRHMKTVHKCRLLKNPVPDTSLDDVDVTSTTGTGGGLYGCPDCDEHFYNSSTLENHMRNDHGSHITHRSTYPQNTDYITVQNSHVCSSCGKVFDNMAILKRHMKIHSAQKSVNSEVSSDETDVKEEFVCMECGKAYSQKVNLKKHITMKHGNPRKKTDGINADKKAVKPFVCLTCGKGFHYRSNLRRHEKTHNIPNPIAVKVPLMENRFEGILNMQGSASSAETSVGKFESVSNSEVNRHLECSECNTHFSSSWKLKNHKCTTSEHACHVCQDKFISVAMLKRHLSIHSMEEELRTKSKNHFANQRFTVVKSVPPLFKCKFCDSSFSSKAQICGHLKKHSGEAATENFTICDMGPRNVNAMSCEKKKESSIVKQVEETDGVIEETPQDTDIFSVEKKTFDCDDCGKSFPTRIQQRRHTNNHWKEKRFKCKLCGKHFPNMYKLNRHLETKKHTVKWPHRCKVCEISFSTKAKMYSHQKLKHGVGKQHICKLCNKYFIDRSKLNRHLQTQKHALLWPYKCNMCSFSFGQSSELDQHLTSFHSIPRKELLITPQQESYDTHITDGDHVETIIKEEVPDEQASIDTPMEEAFLNGNMIDNNTIECHEHPENG